MKQRIFYLLTILILIATAVLLTRQSLSTKLLETAQLLQIADAAPVATTSTNNHFIVSAAGRVEPISEEIKISAQLEGQLKSVLVAEGDHLRRGQTIAILENSDYQAQVALAEAQLLEREAELRRIVNGARPQERDETAANIRALAAEVALTATALQRRQTLYQSGVIAREEVDRAEREQRVAEARLEAAKQKHLQVDDQAREEDRARAEAAVKFAQAQIANANARLDKTVIRAPLSGVVLRKHLKTGESVTLATPVITMADTSKLRVRADVDETDVGRINLGQKAYATADAFGQQRFWGRVVYIGKVLGKKNVYTDAPNERVDTKILETLIEFEKPETLPVGLRVTVHIETSKSLQPTN
jgi:HlyD family secretion protein